MHPLGIAAGGAMAAFYTLFSAALQLWFYYGRADSSAQWKIQPDKGRERLGWRALVPWVPAREALTEPASRVKRAPHHWLLASVNLCMASVIAALTVDAIATGRSRAYLEWPAHQPAWRCAASWAGSTLAIVAGHQVAEYYWHRLMHLPFFYARFHKLHHFYKAPEPFDDLYIHPLEALGYYLILYAPPFVLRMHWSAFGAYMAVMGVCGVLDHCGVACTVPGLYDTRDHDGHHRLFDVNYAFPFAWMDRLHGTHAPSPPAGKTRGRG